MDALCRLNLGLGSLVPAVTFELTGAWAYATFT